MGWGRGRGLAGGGHQGGGGEGGLGHHEPRGGHGLRVRGPLGGGRELDPDVLLLAGRAGGRLLLLGLSLALVVLDAGEGDLDQSQVSIVSRDTVSTNPSSPSWCRAPRPPS